MLLTSKTSTADPVSFTRRWTITRITAMAPGEVYIWICVHLALACKPNAGNVHIVNFYLTRACACARPGAFFGWKGATASTLSVMGQPVALSELDWDETGGLTGLRLNSFVCRKRPVQTILAGQEPSAIGQQPDVGPDRNEAEPHFAVTRYVGGRGGEYACRLATLGDYIGAVAYCCLHIQVAGLPEVPEAGGKVGWTYEDRVYSGCICYGGYVLHPKSTFDLGNKTDPLTGAGHIAWNRIPQRSTGHCAGHTTDPVWRIVDGRHQSLSLHRGLDHRNEQCSCTDIEHLFYRGGIVIQNPDNCGATTPFQCLQLRKQEPDIIRPVFRINEQPIESGSRTDFSSIRFSQAQPQTKLTFASGNRCFESVRPH